MAPNAPRGANLIIILMIAKSALSRDLIPDSSGFAFCSDFR